MSESPRTSSASCSDYLRDQLSASKSISDSHQQSDVINCLQTKIHESVKYQEKVLELEAQIKIAKETIHLQEAAFAFEKNEYENEILALRNSESQLRDHLTQVETNIKNQTYTYEVQVQLSQNAQQIDTLTKKYQKWKSKAKSTQNSLKELQEKISALTEEKYKIELNSNKIKDSFTEQNSQIQSQLESKDHEIQRLKDSLSNAEEKIKEKDSEKSQILEQINNIQKQSKEKRQKQKSILNDSISQCQSMQEQVNQLSQERDSLKELLTKAEGKLTKQKSRIAQLSDELEQSKDCDKLIHQLNDAHEDIESLKDRISNLKMALLQSNSLLEHISIEKDGIADLLGVGQDPLDQEWKMMKNKIEEMNESERVINGLQIQNQKLRARLTSALEIVKNAQVNEKKQVMYEEEKTKRIKLESILSELRANHEVSKALLKRYKIRSEFARTIIDNAHKLSRNVENLHSSIFGSNENKPMKSLALTVIFARRFFNSAMNEAPTDPLALQIFSKNKIFAEEKSEKAFSELLQKFTELSNEVVVAKQNILDLTQKCMDSTKQAAEYKSQSEKSSKDASEMEEKLEALTKRSNELQEELTKLIPPEDYNAQYTKARELKAQNKELQGKITELSAKIEQMETSTAIANEKAQKLKVELKDKDALVEEYVTTIDTKDKSISELNTIIREKSKEILALERIVQRYRQNENQLQSAYTCNAIEIQNNSQISTTTVKTSPQRIVEPDMSFTATINPLFLGH